MELNTKEATEQVAIEFFRQDKESGVIEVRRIEMRVPMNTGTFAASAMMKGYIESFLRRIRGADAGAEEYAGISESLLMFEEVMTKADAVTKRAPDLKPVDAHQQ